MKLRILSSRASARGLTLIELVVVLAILVALAGLIIGNFPSLLKKASGSTSANTLQDIGRAMSIRYTTKGAYATAFDSLIDTAGALTALPAAAKSQVTATLLSGTAGDVTALANLGVTSVVNLRLNSASPDATWSISDLTAGAALVNPLAATDKLALVTDPALQLKLVPNPTAYTGTQNIYLMGVGKNCTLIGGDNFLLEAPTRTGSSDLDNSAQFYQRYCVAFLVDGPSTSRKARFIGAVAPTAAGFEVTDDNTKTYQTN